MTPSEAREIVLDAFDAHLDERGVGSGRDYSDAAKKSGREAMALLLETRGVDFARIAAKGDTPAQIRAWVQGMIRRGLS